MYTDKAANRKLPLLLLLSAALLCAAFLFLRSQQPVREELHAEGARAIQTAVEKSARQCYAIEGVYPPDLNYLETNYGLQLNTRDYYIHYDIYASNIPPEVKVLPKPSVQASGRSSH